MLSGDICAQYLAKVVGNLMTDEAHSIKQRLLPNLRSLLDRMEFIDIRQRKEATSPMIEGTQHIKSMKNMFAGTGLVAAAKSTGRNWRLQESIVETISQLTVINRFLDHFPQVG